MVLSREVLADGFESIQGKNLKQVRDDLLDSNYLTPE